MKKHLLFALLPNATLVMTQAFRLSATEKLSNLVTYYYRSINLPQARSFAQRLNQEMKKIWERIADDYERVPAPWVVPTENHYDSPIVGKPGYAFADLHVVYDSSIPREAVDLILDIAEFRSADLGPNPIAEAYVKEARSEAAKLLRRFKTD